MDGQAQKSGERERLAQRRSDLTRRISGRPLVRAFFHAGLEMEEVESKEICSMLSISASNLWVMLHRARMALRECPGRELREVHVVL